MKKLLILTGAAAITLAGAMQARAALKYETGDYAAQDALVMHLDGIRNVGANRAHDPNASTWIDLAGKAGAITLVKRDASDASAWTDKGYFFAGMSYGISGVALPEMTNLTIEAFGDFPADRQRTSATKYQEYANYVSANALGKDFGIYTYNGEEPFLEDRQSRRVFSSVVRQLEQQERLLRPRRRHGEDVRKRR